MCIKPEGVCGTTLKILVFVVVAVAPVIDCSDTEREAKVGDQVTVTCDVKASPSSRVMWKWTCESEDKVTEQDNIAFNESVSPAKAD